MAAKLLDEESTEETEGVTPIEEQPPQVDKVESKFADKSREEIEQMLTDAQTMIGKQSKDIGDARIQIEAYKKADSFIQGQLNEPKVEQPKEELDYFGNPEQAIQKSIESNPVLTETRDTLKELKQQQAAQQIMAAHPDMVQIVQDQTFIDWVSKDNVRMRLFNEANQDLNVDSANYLFSEYKSQHKVADAPVQQPQVKKSESVRAASTGAATGSSEPVSKKRYRRSDIRRLMNDDPEQYAAREAEFRIAYEEGRVVGN